MERARQNTRQSIDLFPAQHAFVHSPAFEAAFVGGIGSGKTLAGCVRALKASEGMIGTNTRIRVPNLGVVTAPTYPMLRDATLRSFLQVAGNRVVHFNKSEGLIKLANGSEVIFRSTEHPDRLRGPSIAWWFGDEAAMYDRSVWNIMIGRLRQFGQLGYAWIATTPRGRNWVWQVFVQDTSAKREIFRARSEENVYLDRAVLDAWHQTYTGDFALQELGGEFIAFEGLIYPEFRRELHVVGHTPERYAYTIAGVDWGFANPGVILPFGIDSDARMWQVGEHYRRQRRIEDWVEVAKQVYRTWNIQTFYCDPAEPDYIQMFRDAGLPADEANNTVTTGIQAVKSRLVMREDFKPRLMLTNDCVFTIAEYESYQWAENRYGIRDQPVKANDHAMDATRYAAMGIETGLFIDGALNYAADDSIGGSY